MSECYIFVIAGRLMELSLHLTDATFFTYVLGFSF